MESNIPMRAHPRRVAFSFVAAVFFILILLFPGCESELSDDPIPYTAFSDIILNLALPENAPLQSDQGVKSINCANGCGVKGIIVYRVDAVTFRAFERNCSYRPNEACATVEIHSSNLFMEDPCCGSTFDFTGGVTNGPAWRPLRQYRTQVNGSQLTITSEILE